mgnify:CR=1 FL=1
MPRPVVEFWFEFASTYSYLSVMRIERAAQAAGVDIAWKPFLLGPVFLALGWNDSPFNIYPPKGRYMWRDLERLAAKEGLPFQRPSRFPRSGVLAARVDELVEPAARGKELGRIDLREAARARHGHLDELGDLAGIRLQDEDTIG